MTRVFREDDATLEPLRGKCIAVLGYGNQGRAQALNLRDSGMSVIVGNADDEYAAHARKDGVALHSIAEAAARGDIVMSLLPDEVTPAIYRDAIRPGLSKGKTLVFASGYCVCFRQVEFPPDINVIMVAPRTVGIAVRAALPARPGVSQLRRRAPGRRRPGVADDARAGEGHRIAQVLSRCT